MGAHVRQSLFLVYDTVLRVLTYVDVTVQLFAILVMLAATPEKMRQYRYFMLLYTTCDLAFAIMIGVAVHPGTVDHLPCATLRGLLQSLDRDKARFALPLAVFCGATVLGTQDYCIIYRGAVVWREGRHLQSLVTKRAKLIALLAIIGFASLVSFVSYFITTVTEHNPEKDPIMLASLIPGSDAWVCVIDAKSPIWPTGPVVFPLAFATELMFYVLAIATVVFIRKARTTMTEKSRRLNGQLSLLLLVQTTTPIVCIFVPFVFMFIPLIFHFDASEEIPMLSYLFFSIFPLINATLTVVFVKPYRDFTLQLLLKRKPAGARGSVVFVAEQNSGPPKRPSVSTTSFRTSV